MQTIFVELEQIVDGEGTLLQNVLETEQPYSREGIRDWWQGDQGYKNVVIKRPRLVECLVCDGTIYLPVAVYPNWLLEHYIPAHGNVTKIA